MLSAKESIEVGSSNRYVALYKGLKVAVYTVDKPEISLTRQDLVELVNVRSFLLFYLLAPIEYTIVLNSIRALFMSTEKICAPNICNGLCRYVAYICLLGHWMYETWQVDGTPGKNDHAKF